MKEPKLRELVDSPNVDHYLKLPKRLKQKFSAFDRVNAIKAQPHVRLYRVDFADLDNQIRKLSGGRYNAGTVRYRGLPVVASDE